MSLGFTSNYIPHIYVYITFHFVCSSLSPKTFLIIRFYLSYY